MAKHTHDHHQEAFATAISGFWVYLMTDCILFCTLFATYAVLHNSTFGGPSGRDIFGLPTVLAETLFLLTSSFTCGLALLEAHRLNKKRVLAWFGVTFLLGLGFLSLELNEFYHLVKDGHSWRASAFLSSFFTLVGTHGAHITIGLFWMAVFMIQVFTQGINLVTLKRLTALSLFWHFLDVVWIFIFSIVYLFPFT